MTLFESVTELRAPSWANGRLKVVCEGRADTPHRSKLVAVVDLDHGILRGPESSDVVQEIPGPSRTSTGYAYPRRGPISHRRLQIRCDCGIRMVSGLSSPFGPDQDDTERIEYGTWQILNPAELVVRELTGAGQKRVQLGHLLAATRVLEGLRANQGMTLRSADVYLTNQVLGHYRILADWAAVQDEAAGIDPDDYLRHGVEIYQHAQAEGGVLTEMSILAMDVAPVQEVSDTVNDSEWI